MNLDDLDNILLSEKKVEPSPSFARNVMAQVESGSSGLRPLPFPWIPFSAGILIVAIFSIWFFPAASAVHGMNITADVIRGWFLSPENPALQQAFFYTMGSLAGTLILIWLSLRFAGANR